MYFEEDTEQLFPGTRIGIKFRSAYRFNPPDEFKENFEICMDPNALECSSTTNQTRGNVKNQRLDVPGLIHPDDLFKSKRKKRRVISEKQIRHESKFIKLMRHKNKMMGGNEFNTSRLTTQRVVSREQQEATICSSFPYGIEPVVPAVNQIHMNNFPLSDMAKTETFTDNLTDSFNKFYITKENSFPSTYFEPKINPILNEERQIPNPYLGLKPSYINGCNGRETSLNELPTLSELRQPKTDYDNNTAYLDNINFRGINSFRTANDISDVDFIPENETSGNYSRDFNPFGYRTQNDSWAETREQVADVEDPDRNKEGVNYNRETTNGAHFANFDFQPTLLTLNEKSGTYQTNSGMFYLKTVEGEMLVNEDQLPMAYKMAEIIGSHPGMKTYK